jgi:S-disulfanyl-L-cysteine oxidoreductase SoxD
MKTPSFGYRGRALGTVVGVLALAAFATPAHSLLNERSVWSGVYTTTQAERGRAVFEASCAACHSADLSGRGRIPALRGESFTGERHGQSVADLFGLIRSTMPPGRPESLDPDAYADLIAYLLSANAFPPGEGELPSREDVLRGIVFDEPVAASD